jgi:hypothetical protein
MLKELPEAEKGAGSIAPSYCGRITRWPVRVLRACLPNRKTNSAQEQRFTFSEWASPIQIMTAEDRGWHSGPWKPSFQIDEKIPNRAMVFFDGLYSTGEPGPFPFVFTLGCISGRRERLNYS